MKAADVMERVVTDLVDAIEHGAGNWAMPWRQMATTGVPTNAVTHHRYSAGAVLVFGLGEWWCWRQGGLSEGDG